MELLTDRVNRGRDQVTRVSPPVCHPMAEPLGPLRNNPTAPLFIIRVSGGRICAWLTLCQGLPCFGKGWRGGSSCGGLGYPLTRVWLHLCRTGVSS